MSRKHETDYAAELENNYARWDKVFTEGGSDPFWSDGANLSLIRSQILYCKEQLAKQENSLFSLPEVYYRETPPEIDPNYMARPDEIRENARKAMEIIDADENLKFVREQFPSLSEQQRKRWCLSAIINYAENLRQAIAADDLLTMRLYEHLDRYLESFESAANKIRNNETTRLVDFESEDDEEIEGDFDEECSETEQDEDEEISETESDPAEDFQITLF